jgi:hypothetical protein
MQLTHLQRASVWSNNPLPPFHKSLFVPNQTANLDDITGHVVLENFYCLVNRNSTCHKLDYVPGFEDDIWIECFTRGSDGHGAMNKVKGTGNSLRDFDEMCGQSESKKIAYVCIESFCYCTPYFT